MYPRTQHCTVRPPIQGLRVTFDVYTPETPFSVLCKNVGSDTALKSRYAGAMRLRSARVAAAEESEIEVGPTAPTRQSKRRAKPRKADVVEADQPAAAEQFILATEPSHQPDIDAVNPHEISFGHAAAVTDLHPAESPVFNAQAAAEAAQMAGALLRSLSPSEQPYTAIAIPAATSPQHHNNDVDLTGLEAHMPCSQLAAPEEQAACILTSSATNQKFAAHITLTASAEPGQRGHDEQAPLSIALCQSKAEGSAYTEHPAKSVSLCNNDTQGITTQEQYIAEGPAHRSPELRRLTGRASLALQSRRMSRSSSAEAFTRGQLSANGLLSIRPGIHANTS